MKRPHDFEFTPGCRLLCLPNVSVNEMDEQSGEKVLNLCILSFPRSHWLCGQLCDKSWQQLRSPYGQETLNVTHESISLSLIVSTALIASIPISLHLDAGLYKQNHSLGNGDHEMISYESGEWGSRVVFLLCGKCAVRSEKKVRRTFLWIWHAHDLCTLEHHLHKVTKRNTTMRESQDWRLDGRTLKLAKTTTGPTLSAHYTTPPQRKIQ